MDAQDYIARHVVASEKAWRGPDYRMHPPEPSVAFPWSDGYGRILIREGIPKVEWMRIREGRPFPGMEAFHEALEGGRRHPDFFGWGITPLSSALRHVGFLADWPARAGIAPPPRLRHHMAEACGIEPDTAQSLLIAGPLRRVLEALSDEVLSCIAEAQRVEPDTWRILAVDGAEGDRRRTFARSFPFLVETLRDDRVLAEVDAGRSPVRMMAGWTITRKDARLTSLGAEAAIPEAAIRRLARVRPGLECSPRNLVRLAGLVPVSWLPRDDEGWVAMGSVAEGAAWNEDLRPAHGRSLYRKAGSEGWRAMLDALVPGTAVADGRAGAVRDAILDVRDMLGAFQTTVLAPGFARRHDVGGDHPYVTLYRADGMLAAFAVTGLHRLLDLSRRWHADRGGIERILCGSRPRPVRGGWRVPFDPWTAPNGMKLVPLRDREALRVEGDAMRHCVGDYWNRCEDGSCVILSVRGADGERAATAELTPTGAYVVFRLTQLRGLGNGPPGSGAESAVGDLLAALSGERHPVDRGWRREGGRPIGLRELCGYDPANTDASARMLAAWRPFLPRRFRAWDADRFAVEARFGPVMDRIGRGFAEGRDKARRG